MYIEDTFKVYWIYFNCISEILSRYIGNTLKASDEWLQRVFELREAAAGAPSRYWEESSYLSAKM